MDIKKRITKEEINNEFVKYQKNAKKIVNDKTKVNEIIYKTQQWLKKHKDMHAVGTLLEDIEALISLIKDYVDGKYTNIPKASIISAIAAVVYVVSPIDIIPDFVPFAGYLDDTAVVLLALELGLRKDLNIYKKWRQSIIDERLMNKASSIALSINQVIGQTEILGVLILDDFKVRILLNSFNTSSKPFECFPILYTFTDDDFVDDDIITDEDRCNFIRLVFADDVFSWNETCKGRVMREYKCVDFDEYYVILERENDND